MSIKTKIGNMLTNNISHHPRVYPGGGIEVAEHNVSNTGLAGSCALSRIPQVADGDELQSRRLTQNVALRQLPVYCGVYVDGFVQGIDATPTIDMGTVNSMASHRLFRKISEDHCQQLAKKALINATGSKPLWTYGKADVEICMGSYCF